MADEMWIKSYEEAKRKGWLSSVVNYEELFAQSEFEGMKLFRVPMGTVMLPTGNIIVCDPLVYLHEDTLPYMTKVPVGTYAIETLAAEVEENYFRYIATRICFTEEKPVRYELALTGKEDLSDREAVDSVGFPVDAGLATITDVKVRDAYCAFEQAWYEKNSDGNLYDDFFADVFAESYKKAPRFQRKEGDWINFVIPGTKYSIPMIQSGFGDGIYPVYFGYDKDDRICRLVVEYIFCDMEKEMYTEEEEAYFDENLPFLQQISDWYMADEPQKIIQAIMALPKEKQSDMLMGELAVAYNNTEQYEKALEIIHKHIGKHQDDYAWHYKKGFALYYCAEKEPDVKTAKELSLRAKEAFRQALSLKPSRDFKRECEEFLTWIGEDAVSYEKGCKPPRRE